MCRPLSTCAPASLVDSVQGGCIRVRRHDKPGRYCRAINVRTHALRCHYIKSLQIFLACVVVAACITGTRVTGRRAFRVNTGQTWSREEWRCVHGICEMPYTRSSRCRQRLDEKTEDEERWRPATRTRGSQAPGVSRMKVCAGQKYVISFHALKFVHESARTCT